MDTARVMGMDMGMDQPERPSSSQGLILAKAIGIIVIVVGLAVLLAANAVSGVLAKKNPPLSLAASSENGFAWQEMADLKFRSEAVSTETINQGAISAEPDAIRAYELEPLSAKSLALIGLAQDQPDRQDAIMLAAAAINKRDKTLQGNLLNLYIRRGDFAQTTYQLNNILRVKPELKDSILPVLVAALESDQAVPALAKTLNEGTSWTNDFLSLASQYPPVVGNLLTLRQALTAEAGVDLDADRHILRALVAARRYDDAYGAYRTLAKIDNSDPPTLLPRKLDWRAQFHPFDWHLADERGFRAFANSEGDQLEFSISRGSGGVLAERMLPSPAGPFSVTLDYILEPVGRGDNVRLEIACADSARKLVDEMTAAGRVTYDARTPPQGCKFMELRVHARAWSSDGKISGTIKNITLKPQ